MKTINSYRGNVKKSIIELTTTGYTFTGKSGYSKGWANKSVWTSEVISACKELGIEIESGNDASKGGANGEFVCLVSDKKKNRKIWSEMKAAKIAAKKAKKESAEYEAKFIAFIKENKSAFVKNEGQTWSEAITKLLNESGFKNLPIGFNNIKSIIFS